MEIQLLRDQQVFPTNEVLKNVLGECYPVYEELMNIISGEKYELLAEWNYYKDGKAWLCKVIRDKKTIFWLSVWDKYFKTGFYFTEKNCAGITDLDISNDLKEDFYSRKPVGKLIPLSINVSSSDQITDVCRVIDYKISRLIH